MFRRLKPGENFAPVPAAFRLAGTCAGWARIRPAPVVDRAEPSKARKYAKLSSVSRVDFLCHDIYDTLLRSVAEARLGLNLRH